MSQKFFLAGLVIGAVIGCLAGVAIVASALNECRQDLADNGAGPEIVITESRP